MSLKSLIVVLTVALCRTSGKKILCQMVSLDADDGITGYCCVIFRNQSEINMQDEEVKKHILDTFKNATMAEEVVARVAENNGNNSDVVNFPTEDYGEIKFPDATNSEELRNKNVSSADQKTSNATIDSGDKNKTSRNETIVGFAVNRNAVDIPETCPQGSEKDINGDCVPVF